VGSVLPHPYAGFGGGAKIVLPGVSGIDTLEVNHRPVVTGARPGLNDVETNTARAQMEEIALQVGLEAVVHVVTDARRRTVGVRFGHPVAARRAAVDLARCVYATRPPPELTDVVVLNACPKDGELLQVGNAFNVLRSSPVPVVRPGGVIVVTAACPLGRGWHPLHGPIGYHVELGNLSTVAPGANVLGKVRIGEGCRIHANAVILPSLSIGDGAVVRAGSVVVRDVTPGITVFGNPARALPLPG
jgi:hypothetical protein